MAYEKQNWQTGEVITADKLNHMEDGIAGGNAEVIKIATFYSGTRDALGTGVYGFVGGGQLDDSKTLYELIGEKKLVSFAYKVTAETTGGNETQYCDFGLTLAGRSSSGLGEQDPRLFTIEERKQVVGGSVLGITHVPCTKVDIYAVCI